MDLALNNLQRLICHKTQQTKPNHQVSQTLLVFLPNLNNAVVGMVPTCPLIFIFSMSFFQTFPNCTKNINYSWYQCHFHVPQFFQFSSKVEVPMLLFTFFQFYSVVNWDSNVHNRQVFFFFFVLFYKIRSSVEIRWSDCTSKSHRSLCISSSWKDSRLCIYHLFVWSNFNFLHNCKCFTLPTHLCQHLYFFCANFLN